MQELQLANQNFMDQINVHPSTEDFYKDIPDLEKRFDELNQDLSSKLKGRLYEEYFEWGPLQELIEDENINEIVINSYQDIYFESGSCWHQAKDRFLTELTYFNFILRLCHDAGMNFDSQFPFLCGKWKSFRVHISEKSITGSHSLSLRRHPTDCWTFSQLLDHSWCGDEELEQLMQAVDSRKNILVVGPTGSGKTSVINACLQHTGVDDRCIILEDSDELRLPGPLSVKMLTRESSTTKLQKIDLCELVKQSLRMRPDRLVLGEVRGKEAKDLLMALATGHSGSLASIHAKTAQEAILRLEMLIQLGAPNWSLEAIRRLIVLSIDQIVLVGKDNGKRCLKSVWSPQSLESFGVILHQEY